MISKLISLGTSQDTPPHLTKKIRISNRLSIIFFFFALCYGVFFSFHSQPILAKNTLIVGGLQLFVLVFNKFHLQNLSRLYLTISNAFIAYFYSGLIGPDSNFSLFYFACFFAPLVRFTIKEKWQIITCYFFITSFIILDWYSQIHIIDEPLFDREQQLVIGRYMIPATFFLLIFYDFSIIKELEQTKTTNRTKEKELIHITKQHYLEMEEMMLKSQEK